MKSIDFEGNVTPVDHFICGDKPFVGCSDKAKRKFLISHRHGNGLPFFARCAMGTIDSNGTGSTLRYRFTLRPWERFIFLSGVIMTVVFNAIAIFGVIVKPEAEYFVLLTITVTLMLAVWFAPRISQWFFRGYEAEISQALERIAVQ